MPVVEDAGGPVSRPPSGDRAPAVGPPGPDRIESLLSVRDRTLRVMDEGEASEEGACAMTDAVALFSARLLCRRTGKALAVVQEGCA